MNEKQCSKDVTQQRHSFQPCAITTRLQVLFQSLQLTVTFLIKKKKKTRLEIGTEPKTNKVSKKSLRKKERKSKV